MKKRGDIVVVDFGGTNLRVGIARGRKVVDVIRKKTSKVKGELLRDMYASIKSVSSHIGRIGVASPGPLREGVIGNSPNVPLKNFNLREALKKKFRVGVKVENDAACVALAEMEFGIRKKNFFVLTLGTGIGGGVVINGDLLFAGDYGGELGSIYLDSGKTFEELVGGKAINGLTKEVFGKNIDFNELVKLKGSKARRLVDRIGEHYGQGIGGLINVFNPEAVVLAGGMLSDKGGLLKLIQKKTGKYILIPGRFPIVRSKLEEPGLLGAGLL